MYLRGVNIPQLFRQKLNTLGVMLAREMEKPWPGGRRNQQKQESKWERQKYSAEKGQRVQAMEDTPRGQKRRGRDRHQLDFTWSLWQGKKVRFSLYKDDFVLNETVVEKHFSCEETKKHGYQ